MVSGVHKECQLSSLSLSLGIIVYGCTPPPKLWYVYFVCYNSLLNALWNVAMNSLSRKYNLNPHWSSVLTKLCQNLHLAMIASESCLKKSLCEISAVSSHSSLLVIVLRYPTTTHRPTSAPESQHPGYRPLFMATCICSSEMLLRIYPSGAVLKY